VAVLLSVLCARAQGGADFALPADFTRLQDVDELADGDCLLIGAEYEPEDAENEPEAAFYLMTGTPERTWLWAQPMGKGVPENITCEDRAAVWRFRKAGDGCCRLETLDGKFLYPYKTTYLSVSDTAKSEWCIVSQDNGTFLISNKNIKDRALGFSWWPVKDEISVSYFGNYKEGGANTRFLYLYRVRRPDEYRGGAALPADGERVTLFAQGLMAGRERTDGTLEALSADSCELTDGTLAPHPQGRAWVCRHGAEEGLFTLRDADGNYLAAGLGASPTPFDWRISKGYVVPAAAEEGGDATAAAVPHIYLLRNARCFRLLPAAEAVSAGAVLVAFRTVGEDPAVVSGESPGERRLTGAWSADRLRRLDWQGVRSLDLRALALPLRAADFAFRPAADNVPVFIARSEEQAAPEAWRFVVVADGEEATLRNEVVLTDRQPFVPGRAFTVAAGAFAYERQAYTDGLWETVCLPFDAQVPDGFVAETLTEIRAGELFFSSTDRLEGGKPAIVRYVGPSEEEKVSQRWEAEPGSVWTAPATDVFAGVFDTLRVNSTAEGIYLLDNTGQTFVRAAAGSSLCPFRAYLKPGGNGQTAPAAWAVRHADREHTAVGTVDADPPSADRGACYDLQGRRVGVCGSGIPASLPPGIYIRNGKKIKRK